MSDTSDPRQALASASLVCTADEVLQALDRMASAVTEALADKNPIVLAVMKGGAFVATELCKRMAFPYVFDYVHVTRYGPSLTGGELVWKTAPTTALEDRVVLIVDDILDRGHTLSALLASVTTAGAADVLSAVLVQKDLQPAIPRPTVDFVGLTTADLFLFGCGMDYRGYWRGLPEIYGVPRP
jgi:hypoxanthine phosphoribosyltransferase